MSPTLNKHLAIALFLLECFCMPLSAATESESAIVIRTAAVKVAPSFGAKTVTILPAGKPVKLGVRVGGWQKITVLPASSQTGWLRTYQVRAHMNTNESVIQNRTSDRGVLSGLSSLSSSTASLFGKREMEGNSGNVTATMGVRGLSEADLKNARPNMEELRQFEKNSVNSKNAKQFAQVAGLKAHKVKELPEPKKSKKKKKKQREN